MGENATITLNGTYRMSGIKVLNGYQKTEDTFYKNSRPTWLTAYFSDGSSEEIYLNDAIGWQTITFGAPHDTTSITLVINSVSRGNKYEDTCLSEIELF